jgi:hypothetical protein
MSTVLMKDCLPSEIGDPRRELRIRSYADRLTAKVLSGTRVSGSLPSSPRVK